MTTATLTLTDFLLARIAEDEAVARLCAETFPSPWDVADRGWRVRIYAADVSVEDFSSDDPSAMTVRNPVVMEVEPDRHIEDPRWLSERVEHVRRHDPARVLAECEAKREVVRRARRERGRFDEVGDAVGNPIQAVVAWEASVRILAAVYSDHPDYDESWRP